MQEAEGMLIYILLFVLEQLAGVWMAVYHLNVGAISESNLLDKRSEGEQEAIHAW